MLTKVNDDGLNKDVLEVSLRGLVLLHDPLLNKGSAFPEDERREFGLSGLLPPHIASMGEQVNRTYWELPAQR